MAMTTGPIIIIDDNVEDLQLYKEVFASLEVNNEVLVFDCPEVAFEYLKERIDPCFFILCDINMPKMNGFELRAKINKDFFFKYKTIPFLFLTTANHVDQLNKAYTLSIQGYFNKPSEFKSIQSLFKSIVGYWANSLQPILPIQA